MQWWLYPMMQQGVVILHYGGWKWDNGCAVDRKQARGINRGQDPRPSEFPRWPPWDHPVLEALDFSTFGPWLLHVLWWTLPSSLKRRAATEPFHGSMLCGIQDWTCISTVFLEGPSWTIPAQVFYWRTLNSVSLEESSDIAVYLCGVVGCGKNSLQPPSFCAKTVCKWTADQVFFVVIYSAVRHKLNCVKSHKTTCSLNIRFDISSWMLTHIISLYL